MSEQPRNALLWFAVLGGATAWAVQFVASLGFGWAQCNSPPDRFGLPVHGWDVALAAAAALVAVLAALTALRIFLATREVGNAPPLGRVHFLATIGLTVNPLALAIIVMSGIGVSLLPLCHQS